jgi:TorA maturation chaperone TorD
MVHEISPRRTVEEVDIARAREYALLATLLTRSPRAQLLANLACLPGGPTQLGQAHTALAESAVRSTEISTADEYSSLFAGVSDGALLPYASHYLANTLYGRPLARLRETLGILGIEKGLERIEPEDHVGILCEIMAALIDGGISAPAGADRMFFSKHLGSWLNRFFVDLENVTCAPFYKSVGTLGRTFIEIEAEAFAL